MTGPVPVGRTPRPAPGRPGSPRTPFVLLVVGLLIGTTIGVLVLNTAIAVDSLKATSLRTANAQRSQEVQRLQQQVVQAGAPGQLAARAGQAGLVPAGTPGYLVIRPDGTSVLQGTPSPAPTPPPAPASASGTAGRPAPAPTPAAVAPAPDGTSVAGD
jgi:type II secretory pathway pseudopilin PulG